MGGRATERPLPHLRGDEVACPVPPLRSCRSVHVDPPNGALEQPHDDRDGGPQREALLAEIQRGQQPDGGWSLQALGPWRSSKAARFWVASLFAKADGYATGLIVYTLRQAGLPADHPAVRKGRQWLKAHQQGVQVGQRTDPAWRSYSLNVDREHGEERGEPWRRLFMSDAATAFAILALVESD